MALKKSQDILPSFDELMIPTIKALQEIGGSGTIEEINNKVYELAKISHEILKIPHGNSEGTIKAIDYRLAWSRTYLKKFGLLENSTRGIWALTKSDIDIEHLNYLEIVKQVRLQTKSTKTLKETEQEITEEVNNSEEWKEQLLKILYKITPDAFERLSQRILRESGFFQVEVTGKSGDGGIDGRDHRDRSHNSA